MYWRILRRWLAIEHLGMEDLFGTYFGWIRPGFQSWGRSSAATKHPGGFLFLPISRAKVRRLNHKKLKQKNLGAGQTIHPGCLACRPII